MNRSIAGNCGFDLIEKFAELPYKSMRVNAYV
jgi:hypothetical protein